MNLALHRGRRRLPRPGAARRRAGLVSLAVVLGFLAVTSGAAVAGVHDNGVFELDGDATTTLNQTTTHDWDQVCYQKTHDAAMCGTSTGAAADAVAWVAEPDPSATIFTGGGSKDPSDINQWAWKNAGGLPDKDNLLHGFASRYGNRLFFGSDRYDNSGDAQQGFWFLQSPITLGSTPISGGQSFAGGVHQNGDILVISDFSNGGGTSTISIYTWDNTCKKGVTSPKPGDCGDVNLRLRETSTSANCKTATGNDPFCGITNIADGVKAPWPFQDKSGNHTYLNGEFFEGGLDLGTLGLGDRCFSAFASETRSSTSTTATLKDFVLGGFGACGATTTSQAQSGGSNVPDAGLSIGGGTVTTNDTANITVTGVANWSGTVSFKLQGPRDDIGGTNGPIYTIGSSNVNQSTGTVTGPSAVITEVGHYCWNATFHATSPSTGITDAADDGTNECFDVNPVTPTLTTSAGHDVTFGSPVTDTAYLTGTATGPANPVVYPVGATPAPTAGAAAGGTITWKLYGPNPGSTCDSTTLATPATASTSTLSANVSGDRSATTSGYGPASETPSAVGSYAWVATYTPDTAANPNNVGSSGSCTDTAEAVSVTTMESTLTSAQSYVPNDKVTIGAAADGTTPGGTVTFELFPSTDCSGTQVGSDMAVSTAVGGDGKTTAVSTNTTAGTWANVSWKVKFVPTGSAYETVPFTCLEKTAVTIDNGGTASSRTP